MTVSPLRPRRRGRPRIGLVLGAGGVLGAAWTAGALAALQERVPYPLGGGALVVGPSAGSGLAAGLRCGVGVDDIVAHQGGSRLAALPHLGELDRDAGPWPPLPRMRIGSPRLLFGTALAPHRVHPWVAASALVLQGRGGGRSPAPPLGAPGGDRAAGPPGGAGRGGRGHGGLSTRRAAR